MVLIILGQSKYSILSESAPPTPTGIIENGRSELSTIAFFISDLGSGFFILNRFLNYHIQKNSHENLLAIYF